MWTEKSKDHFRLCAYYIDPLTGQRHKIGVTYYKDTAQAKNKAESKLNELISKKISHTPDNMTLSTLIDHYLTFQKKTVKHKTWIRNESICRQFLKILGDCSVNALTAGLVKDRFMTYTSNPTTINEYIGRFKALIRFGFQNDFISDISWLDKLVKLKDNSKKEKLRDKYLEQSECEKLIAAMDHTDWRNLTMFLIQTGCRIGEALALTEDDIDLTSRTITISKTIDLNEGILDTPKTLSSVRQIFIQDELLPLTRSVIAQNRKKNNILYLYSPRLFSSLTASQTGYDAFRKYLRETSERVLGRKITPHVLRHTHASLLAQQGISYEAIAHRLGHENSRITKAIYIHITEKRKEMENDMIRGVRLINFA